ncbi:hypothetical protein GGF46_003549 [Coemansia sp. RSA 552]|nr:hypothetical protein GGF46_003549 [Coemansia sp. RSA 552]
MPTHKQHGGMAVTEAASTSAPASPGATPDFASPRAVRPEEPIKVVLETGPPPRKPGRPRLDISAHFQDTGEMANHSHRFVWCIACIKSGCALYKKDRIPARGDLMQRHLSTCKHVADEVRQKFCSQRSSSTSSAGDSKAKRTRIASIVSDAGSSSAAKASSTSPRARSRSRPHLRPAAAPAPTPAAAPASSALPPVSAVTGAEQYAASAVAHMPVGTAPALHQPLPPMLRPPYSQIRPISAEAVLLPRIRSPHQHQHSPQRRPTTPVDLPPISRRPHPYYMRDSGHGHGSRSSSGGSAALRTSQAPSTPVISPPRIHTPPQTRAYLTVPPPPPPPLSAMPLHAHHSSPLSGYAANGVADVATPPTYCRQFSHEPAVANTSGTLRRRLHSGKDATYGIVLSIPSAVTARTASRLGFDWACIDMEHSPQSASIMAEMVEAIAGSGGCVPLVRVPSHSGEWIRWAVEAGAQGIIVPNIQNREQMVQIVSLCRGATMQFAQEPSHSGPVAGRLRGFSQPHRMAPPPQQHHSPMHGSEQHYGTPYGASTPTDDARAADLMAARSDVLIIPQIESPQGIRNFEEIISVPGIDAAFVRPQGLWLGAHSPPALVAGDHPPFPDEALDRVLYAARQHAVPLGIDSVDGAAARIGVRQGFHMVAVGSDVDVLASAAADQLRLAQSA